MRAWRAWSFAIAGFALLAVADTIYLYGTATGSYEVGGVLDAAWPAGMVLVAAAAWQPPGRLDGSVLRDRGFLPVPLAAGLSATGAAAARPLPPLRPGRRVGAPAAACSPSSCASACTFRDNGRMLRASRREAATDALTGLGNRRALIAELESRLAVSAPSRSCSRCSTSTASRPTTTTSATRPATCCCSASAPSLAEVGSTGRAFRMGGDEFCVLFPANHSADLVGRARQALSEEGEGFAVTASAGTVALPGEARTVSEALSIADRRMYAHKRSGRTSASNQAKDVLLRAVQERNPHLGTHGGEVAELAELTAKRLGLEPTSCARSARAPSCTTSASSRSPTRSSPRQGRSTTTSGRSCTATRSSASASSRPRPRCSTSRRWSARATSAGTAPATPTASAARRSRSARASIGVCDAWDAMVTDRPYRRALPREEALAELERCSGSQFDPSVVEAFRAVVEQPRVRHLRALPRPDLSSVAAPRTSA